MLKTQETESTVTKTAGYDLIRGEFEAQDAAEIINHMLMKKINFHEVRNFSQEIRCGEKDEQSLQRIKELKEIREQINEQISLAKANGKLVKISATIFLELV